MSNKKEEEKKVQFKGQWTETEKTGLDYSRKFEKQYKEIPPYTKDDKGNFLNDSSQPKLVESEPFDVDEYIQSFKDDCDIYQLLEKAYLSQNVGLLNRNDNGIYDDISELPEDPYEFENLQRNLNEELVKINSSEEKKEEIKEEIKEEKKEEEVKQ